MELSSKTTDMLGDLTTLGTGVMAWIYTATAKWPTGAGTVPYTLRMRVEDAIASTFGKGVMQAIEPGYSRAADLEPKMFGWVNKTTGSGILLGIADWIAGEVYPPYAKDMDGLRKIVKGAATGVTIGGIIGGIFDPAPKTNGHSTFTGSESGSQQSSSYVDAVVAHNRGAVA